MNAASLGNYATSNSAQSGSSHNVPTRSRVMSRVQWRHEDFLCLLAFVASTANPAMSMKSVARKPHKVAPRVVGTVSPWPRVK